MVIDLQIATFILSFVNLIIIPLGLFLYKQITKWRKEANEQEEIKAERDRKQKKAWQALLKDRIMQSGEFFERLGGIPSRTKQNLLDIGAAYEDLDGNGEGKKMIKVIAALPVDDKILDKYHAAGSCQRLYNEGKIDDHSLFVSCLKKEHKIEDE